MNVSMQLTIIFTSLLISALRFSFAFITACYRELPGCFMNKSNLTCLKGYPLNYKFLLTCHACNWHQYHFKPQGHVYMALPLHLCSCCSMILPVRSQPLNSKEFFWIFLWCLSNLDWHVILTYPTMLKTP